MALHKTILSASSLSVAAVALEEAIHDAPQIEGCPLLPASLLLKAAGLQKDAAKLIDGLVGFAEFLAERVGDKERD